MEAQERLNRLRMEKATLQDGADYFDEKEMLKLGRVVMDVAKLERELLRNNRVEFEKEHD